MLLSAKINRYRETQPWSMNSRQNAMCGFHMISEKWVTNQYFLQFLV